MSTNFTNKEEGTFSRRDLLRGVGLLGAGALLGSTVAGCGSSNNDFVFTNTNPVNPGPPPVPPVTFTQPEVFRSVDGFLSVPFDIRFATNVVGTPNGPRNFQSRTINGVLNPPTIIVQGGDRLEIPITNNLPPNAHPHPMPPDENTPHNFNTINMHTHGFHVSPGDDDVLLRIFPGEAYTYKYDIPLDHWAGTFWYHPHKHGATAMHLFSGMIGAIIMKQGDGTPSLDTVPEVAAAADLVFNINELVLGGSVDPSTQSPANPLGSSNDALGFGSEAPGATVPLSNPYTVPNYTKKEPFRNQDSIFLVNGEYQPKLTMRPGQTVRLRILNASARQAAPLTITGGTGTNLWHLLSFDGLTLPAVRTAPEFTLAPANRADAVIKFDQPGTYQIVTQARVTNTAGTLGPVTLATVEVVGELFDMPLPTGALPVSPALPDITDAELAASVAMFGPNVVLSDVLYAVNDPDALVKPGPIIPNGAVPSAATTANNFTINGVRFDGSTVNYTLPLNSVVEWTLINTSGARHPHHIHINPFQIMSSSDGMYNGLPLIPGTWADTVAIPGGTAAEPGTVVVRQRLEDFAGFFVFHCHILVHEDIGMMQLVHVS